MKNKEEQKIEYPKFAPHICESDGAVYTSNPPQWRCKICGKFEYAHKATMKPFVPDYIKNNQSTL